MDFINFLLKSVQSIIKLPPKIRVRCGTSLVLLSAIGCGTTGLRIASTGVSLVVIQGKVHGGQQPLVGASIQLYAAGTTGDASSALPLLSTAVITDGGGRFSINGDYTCPSASSLVYLTATGGDPGLGRLNNASALMSALGPCGALNSATFVAVDEVSTVASVYPLTGFIGSGATVGASPAHAADLAARFDQVNAYIDIHTGLAPGLSLPSGEGVPIEKLYTLANVVAACVNSAGGKAGDGSPCGNLFMDVTGQEGVPPTNTIEALTRIAQSPLQNVVPIFNLTVAGGPYMPTLAVAPTDWALNILPTLVLSSPVGQAALGSNSGTVTLGQAAPAGGLAIQLTSSNPGVLSVVSPIVVAAGQTAAWIQYTGMTLGSSILTATAPNYLGGTLNVSTSSLAILVGVVPTLAPGQSVPLSISLSSPAPAGGTTIELGSSNNAVALITPSAVTIAGGAVSPSLRPQVTGSGFGTSQILASNIGYAVGSTWVNVTLQASLPSTFSAPIDVPAGLPATETLTISSPAPAGGLTFNLSVDDPKTLTVPLTVTVAPGATSVGFPVTSIKIGDTIIRAKAPGFPEMVSSVRALYSVCSMWGDSLTQGNEDSSGVTVETALQSLGYCGTIYNEGIGGQQSGQIAVRSGAIPSASATITSGVIPASGPTKVTWAVTAYQPVTDQGPAQALTISGVDGISYFDGRDYIFERTTPGMPVTSSPDTPVIVHPPNVDTGFTIIWSGNNNYQSPNQVKADIAAMVAHLPSPKHFLIVSVINGDDIWVWKTGGQTQYPTLIQLDKDLSQTYASNYLDIRALEVAAYDPTNPQDVIDLGHDIPPSHFRAQDFGGALMTDISDSTSCDFTLSQGFAWYGSTVTMEGEKIYISGTDGTTVSACTRGYASTLAVAHKAGVRYLGLDPIHQNGPVAGVFMANQIKAWMQSH